VLDTLHRKEIEVQARSGRGFPCGIMPYRTVDNVIDGVVLTFVDTTRLKEAEIEAQDARKLAEAIVNGMRDSLLVLRCRPAGGCRQHLLLSDFQLDARAIEGSRYMSWATASGTSPS